jgi:hypothetical protein
VSSSACHTDTVKTQGYRKVNGARLAGGKEMKLLLVRTNPYPVSVKPSYVLDPVR